MSWKLIGEKLGRGQNITEYYNSNSNEFITIVRGTGASVYFRAGFANFDSDKIYHTRFFNSYALALKYVNDIISKNPMGIKNLFHKDLYQDNNELNKFLHNTGETRTQANDTNFSKSKKKGDLF